MNGYYTSSWHDFSVYFNPSSGNAVSWDDSLDEPAMTLGAKDAGMSKFKPIHELGHVFQVDAISPSSNAELQAFLADYSANGAGHTVFGEEYTAAADVEGFAHYVSSATWNNLGDNADGIWLDWGDDGASYFSDYVIYDIENGHDELSSYCSGTSCCGYGVEMDWARTFWDFRTDGSSGKPGTMDMLAVFADAYIWNTNSTSCSSGSEGSHFVGISNSIGSVLGSLIGARFDSNASWNGSNH